MKTRFYLPFLVALLMFYSGISQETQKVISGMVTDGQNPIKNVQITIKDAETSVFTDTNGKYIIEASVEDVLVFSYTGLRTLEILVEDVTRIVNLSMFPQIEELNEVVVTKSKRRSQQELEVEYNSNPYLIRSAYGIIDPETSAFQIRVLPENSISTVGLCILDVVRADFPGVAVFGDCINGGSIFVRGVSSISYVQPAIYDVDGQIFTNTPIWLSPGNMERIAVMSGLAARNLYGSIASGGVVVINTNVGNGYEKSNELRDKAKLRDNIFKGPALTQKELMADMPTYYQKFYASASFEEAEQVFEFYRPQYNGNYIFYLDAYDYFASQWRNVDFSNSLIEANFGSFEENPIAMKALAFYYEAYGQTKKAVDIYKKVFSLRPSYAQSYLDLAKSYRDVDELQKATALYMRYGHLVEEGILGKAEDEFSLLYERELNNLVTLQGKSILPESQPKNYVMEDDFEGTRLVFEWSDSEAEFDLQFVNPEKHYFLWEHSLYANETLIKDEKSKGYSTKEYLIDESLKGNWQINVKYLGNKSLTPTFLKATIHYNYGKASQRKEVKVFKLQTKGVNQNLFSLNISNTNLGY